MSEGRAAVERFGVSRETSARLAVLASLLEKWNPRINLVSRNTLNSLWERHILDSAQVFRLAPEGARSWADLGSGGGFPGLVVAAMAADEQPDMHVTLIESDARKCVFLSTAAREMEVHVTVLTARIEKVEAGPFDVISARALAALPKLLELSAHLGHERTVRLFPKGAGAASELTEAERAWHIRCRSHASLTDRDAVILEILEAARDPVRKP